MDELGRARSRVGAYGSDCESVPPTCPRVGMNDHKRPAPRGYPRAGRRLLHMMTNALERARNA
jgi:hypothetical protein